MAKDSRDILQVLKMELDFLEHGGYRRSPRTGWRAPLVFEDSPTCLNFNRPDRPNSCEDCVLIKLVPAEYRTEAFPCRHIPLTQENQTLNLFYEWATQQELDDALRHWLQRTIQQLEAERAKADDSENAERQCCG
jgi:hypothetical protein